MGKLLALSERSALASLSGRASAPPCGRARLCQLLMGLEGLVIRLRGRGGGREADAEGSQRRAPVVDAASVVLGVGDGEVKQLAGGVFGGEVPPGLMILRLWRFSASTVLGVVARPRSSVRSL